MYKTIASVAVEPVSIGEVKLHLRLTDDTTEDDLLSGLITTAREYCEKYTGRSFAEQTLELLLDSFPVVDYIELPSPPLKSVSSVTYKDSAGTINTMAAADYIVDTDRPVGRVALGYGKSWPSFTAYPSNPIRIRFVCGYSMIPQSLKQAMLLLIGHWYENREGFSTGTIAKQLEFSINALLSQYRVRWWD